MSTLKVTGTVTHPMSGHFKPLIEAFLHVFERATGEKLIAGTLNIKVGGPIKIKEDFRTPSDIAKEKGHTYYTCDICGSDGPMIDGAMCEDCIRWMETNGLTDKDLPVITSLRIRDR